MTISDKHIEALERHVRAGHFPDLNQALEAALDQLDAMFDDECDWAAPYLAEADAAVAAGEVEDWKNVR